MFSNVHIADIPICQSVNSYYFFLPACRKGKLKASVGLTINKPQMTTHIY